MSKYLSILFLCVFFSDRTLCCFRKCAAMWCISRDGIGFYHQLLQGADFPVEC